MASVFGASYIFFKYFTVIDDIVLGAVVRGPWLSLRSNLQSIGPGLSLEGPVLVLALEKLVF